MTHITTPTATKPPINIFYNQGVGVTENAVNTAMDSLFRTIESPVRQELISRIDTLAVHGAQHGIHDEQSNAETVQSAKNWICRMYEVALSTSHIWRDPMITTSQDGEIVFEWWREVKKLTVYIYNDGIDAVRRSEATFPATRYESMANSNQECRTLWVWLMEK